MKILKYTNQIIGLYLLNELILILYFFAANRNFLYLNQSFWILGLLYLFILTIIFSCLLVYSLLRKLNQETKEEAELTLSNLEKDHLLATLKAEEDLEHLKTKLKEIVGDKTLNSAEAQATVQDLLQKEASSLFINYCSNPMIDAILYHKVLRMKEAHIDYSIVAAVPETLDIEPYALLSVLTNMIDNAIEAIQDNQQERTIQIEISMKANYLKCKVINSIETIPQLDGNKTKKADKNNHGLGLQILKTTCKRYDGRFTIHFESGQCTSIALLRNEKEES